MGTVRLTMVSLNGPATVLGTTDVSETDGGALGIIGVDDHHTVYFDNLTAQHAYRWTPGQSPFPSPAGSARRFDRRPERTCRRTHDERRRGCPPDGSQVLSGADPVEAIDVASGHRVRLRPIGPIYAVIGFEYDGSALLTVGPTQHGPLDRCSTTMGSCVQVRPNTRGITFAGLP